MFSLAYLGTSTDTDFSFGVKTFEKISFKVLEIGCGKDLEFGI